MGVKDKCFHAGSARGWRRAVETPSSSNHSRPRRRQESSPGAQAALPSCAPVLPAGWQQGPRLRRQQHPHHPGEPSALPPREPPARAWPHAAPGSSAKPPAQDSLRAAKKGEGEKKNSPKNGNLLESMSEDSNK